MLTRQGSTFHFRRAVPARLRPFIGQTELWASLGRSSATIERAKAGLLYAAVERTFAVAEKIISLPTTIQSNDNLADTAKQTLDLRLRADAEVQQIAALTEEQQALQQRLHEYRMLSTEIRHQREMAARTKAMSDRVAALMPLIDRAHGHMAAARQEGERAKDGSKPAIGRLRTGSSESRCRTANAETAASATGLSVDRTIFPAPGDEGQDQPP
ncbi:DUF6538 domain-containing protein [Rhodopila globiformis]|uniref:DUF6538 domain-containing protein n=1 Tax=Rhodopila globiformis TaxID=1071 RepID=UPI0011B0EC1C|nr:DUF6538 domain-containing protein [Rhodopila globiformis]